MEVNVTDWNEISCSCPSDWLLSFSTTSGVSKYVCFSSSKVSYLMKVKFMPSMAIATEGKVAWHSLIADIARKAPTQSYLHPPRDCFNHAG